MDLSDVRLIGPSFDISPKSREAFRKDVDGITDKRLVHSPLWENSFSKNGEIKNFGLEGTIEFLKNHHIIAIDPGSRQSAASGHCLSYDIKDGLCTKSISDKFARFGTSNFKGDTAKTGAGFDEGRTIDSDEYKKYSIRYKERCPEIIASKYLSVQGNIGVGIKRKKTQQARAAVANKIMALYKSLNVSY